MNKTTVAVEQILQQCTVQGKIVKLPGIQLERKTYLDVAKEINQIGGKWKGGKVSGFVFEQDPTELLLQIASGEKCNLQKEYQFFETPQALADKLVSLADINECHSILEPSAGRGALLTAINKVLPGKMIDCYELMDLNQSFLKKIPTASFKGAEDLESWPCGVYFLPKSLRAAILAINELPVTEETLWFRLLGRGAVQQQAVSELVALPPENLVRRNVLEMVYRWRISVMTQTDLTLYDQELIMNLTEAYQEARAQAVQEGVEQGQRQVVENLLRFRFGEVDEELSRVVDSLLQLSPEEFTPLCLQLSREELLTRFVSHG
jgi:hypothetical protein